MTFKSSIADDTVLTEPKILTEGDAVAFKIIVPNVQSTLSTAINYWYKENSGSDQASTYLTSSSGTVSGIDTIITATTQNLKAGNWILTVKATVDGQVQIVSKTPIIVKRQNQI